MKHLRAVLVKTKRAGTITVSIVHGSSLGQAPHLPGLQDAESNNCPQALRLQPWNAVEWYKCAEGLGDGVARNPSSLQTAVRGTVKRNTVCSWVRGLYIHASMHPAIWQERVRGAAVYKEGDKRG